MYRPPRVGTRRYRYWKYREEHFLPAEARELSKLRSLRYHELRIMVRERRQLWRAFKNRAERVVWSPARQSREWPLAVELWYVHRGYTHKAFAWWKKFPQNNVWFWFDDAANSLPEEMRYTTGARRKGMTTRQRMSKASHEAQQAMRQRFVDGLMRTVGRSPERDINLTEQAQRLGFKGTSLYNAARRKGYA